jgi:anti-sigma factor RsiW
VAGSHPEREIVPYLNGELTGADHERVARHLEACPDCRQTAETAREVLDLLSRAMPGPPPLHRARYLAEVRERIERRRPAGPVTWWRRPLPIGVSAALAAAVLVLALETGVRERGAVSDPGLDDEVVLGQRLQISEDSPLLERLDLLEDLDVIRNLDGLAATRGS